MASHSMSDLGLVIHLVARLVFDLASHSVSDLGSASYLVARLVFGLASRSVPDLGLVSHSVSDLGLVIHLVAHLVLGSASHLVSGLGLASHLVARLVFGLASRSVSGLGLASHSASDLGSASHLVARLVFGLASRSVLGLSSASHSVPDLGLASHLDSPIRRMRYHNISLLRYLQALPLLPDLPDRLPLPYAADTVLLQHLPDLHCNPVPPHYSYNPPDCQRMYHIHHSGRQQGLQAVYSDLPLPVPHHLIWMLRGDADILPHSHYSRLQNNVSPCYFQADISSVRLPSCCNYRLSWITSGLPDRRSAP